jgi:hypothetical protein
MKCAECARLRTETKLRADTYKLAADALQHPTSCEQTNTRNYRPLQMKRESTFNWARVELAQHQRQHATPNDRSRDQCPSG